MSDTAVELDAAGVVRALDELLDDRDRLRKVEAAATNLVVAMNRETPNLKTPRSLNTREALDELRLLVEVQP